MDIIEYSHLLSAVTIDSQDLLGSEVENLRGKHGIDAPDSLQNALEEISQKNRLLNIGIVGRVKAGKSSLLNALFFNGRSILPKAATPMTAALTTLSYGDEFSACVEFYSQNDLKRIQEQSRIYEQRLYEKQEQYCRELTERHKKRTQAGSLNPTPNDHEIRDKAKEAAIRDLRKDLSLDAAHDQAQRIHKSGINPATLAQQTNIHADSPESLAKMLTDFVGADGRFMPFTKIVHIFMPMKELQDIQVIDTPGLNDPVQSREERTIELLKTCDVVFIVSPAGQFLSEQDLEMMGRITAKEGVQELVLISSQIDSQLHGSEKRARLSDALTNIQKQLAVRAGTALSELKKSNPEVGNVFDSLIHSAGDHLLYSSGVAYSLATSLEQPDEWDENEEHTWRLLGENYPDFFSHENLDVSRNSLNLLANVDAIHNRLRGVRAKKGVIAEEKLGGLIKSKRKGLEDFRADFIQLVIQRIERVKNANIDSLSTQLRMLDAMRKKLSLRVDPVYDGCMGEYRHELRQSLVRESRNLLGKTSEKVEQAGSESTVNRTREKQGAGNWLARKLWGGGYESYQETVHSVMTGHVASAIRKFVADVTHHLSSESEVSKIKLDKKLSKDLAPVIFDILGDTHDTDMVAEAVRSVIRGLPDHKFDLGITLPDNLREQGTLKGLGAERYKDDSADFVSRIDGQVTDKIDRFVRDIESGSPKTVSDSFMDDLEEKIRSLRKQKENADQTIARLQEIADKLKGLKG